MAIRNVFTMGYGNGTFSPGVKFLVTLGYATESEPIGPICLHDITASKPSATILSYKPTATITTAKPTATIARTEC